MTICYVRRDDVRARRFNGQRLILLDSRALELNESAALIWRALETPRTMDELVAALTDEYDIDLESATADASQFVGFLTEQEFVKTVSD